MAEPRIVEAGPADAGAWARLRVALWPADIALHEADIAAALRTARPGPPATDRLALIAYAGADAIGLAEAAIRHDYVNGCDTSPVAFLDGVYVDAAWRRQGIARRLVDRVATWGRRLGCSEFASDADADNLASHRLHAALGFATTERVVYFRRPLA